AFFVVAPVHEGAVAWIAARGHVLVTAPILLTIVLFRHFRWTNRLRYYFVCMLTSIGALMTQELAVTLPALLLLQDVIFRTKRPDREWAVRLVLVHGPMWCLLLAYLGFRYLM